MSDSATTIPLSAGTWSVDPARSKVSFAVRHLGLATTRGEFRRFEGRLTVADDPAAGTAHGTVAVASVSTGDEPRDDFLRSPDLFDAAAHPEISFASRRIEPAGSGAFRIVGNLAIRGVAREVALEAVVREAGDERVRLEVSGQISRRDYGVKFGRVLGTGDMAVGDKVRLALDISAVRRP